MENLNQIYIIGKIVAPIVFSHECYGEKFYSTLVDSTRTSGIDDILEISIPERVFTDILQTNDTIELWGRIDSRNVMISGKSKLNVYVFVTEMNIVDESTEHQNIVNLEGFICKPPTFRETPSGREISDLILASNNKYNKGSYVPSIAWSRNAKFVACKCNVGTELRIDGRLQSRTYIKEGIEMTVYELSVSKFEIIQEEKKNAERVG